MHARGFHAHQPGGRWEAPKWAASRPPAAWLAEGEGYENGWHERGEASGGNQGNSTQAIEAESRAAVQLPLKVSWGTNGKRSAKGWGAEEFDDGNGCRTSIKYQGLHALVW